MPSDEAFVAKISGFDIFADVFFLAFLDVLIRIFEPDGDDEEAARAFGGRAIEVIDVVLGVIGVMLADFRPL